MFILKVCLPHLLRHTLLCILSVIRSLLLRLQLLSYIEIILCNEFIDVYCDIIGLLLLVWSLVDRFAFLETFCHHICTIGHEDYDARFDALVQELFSDTLMLLLRKFELSLRQVVQLVILLS